MQLDKKRKHSQQPTPRMGNKTDSQSHLANNPLANIAFNANKVQEEIVDFENGLKKLFEITGVNDVNEVIQKFITQDETENSLRLTRENYTKRLDELVSVKSKLRESIEDLKFDKTMHVGNHQLEASEDKVNKLLIRQDRWEVNVSNVQDQDQEEKDVQVTGRGEGGHRTLV
jgi:hypothetical protein